VDGVYKDRWVSAWVGASLAATKSKKPTLAQLLVCALNKEFKPDQADEVTGDITNSMIGCKIRIATILEEGKSYATVSAFYKDKNNTEPF
jgi:hypothetical protein